MSAHSNPLEGLPKRFVNAMRTLFDILDDGKTDSVRYSDIEQFWQDDGSKGLPRGVLESLQKVTPPNGLLTFERFCAGLKICLMRNQMEAQKEKINDDYRKPLSKRPPSAPTLENNDNINKHGWPNTATVRPNNALASRTLSMPQLQSAKKSSYSDPPLDGYPVYPETQAIPAHHEGYSPQGEYQDQRLRNAGYRRHLLAVRSQQEGVTMLPEQARPLLQTTNGPLPYYPQSSGASLYGPPKPPRSALAERSHPQETFGPPQRQNSQENILDRAEIRTALHNWQKGQIMHELDPNRAFLNGRSLGDGKPAGADQPIKKPLQRKREPRRHTLQNGVDFNMLKKIKHLEQEKDTLLQGLAAVDRTREWYHKQLGAVTERMKYLGRVGPSAEPLSEAQSERLELQKARVLEVNRHLATLTESWERGGLPLHMNLAVRHLTSSDLSRVKHQNHLLTKEVSEKSEKIAALEKEKTNLVMELYKARGIRRPNQPTSEKVHERPQFL